MRPALAAIVVASALAGHASPSLALGFGRTSNATSLGQPLDFSVAITTLPGDVVEVECVSATVLAGESALPRDAIHLSVEPGNGQSLVRVQTLMRIEEPVVSVTLNVGCPSRLSRRFVNFVDPPSVSLPSVAAGEATTPADSRNALRTPAARDTAVAAASQETLATRGSRSKRASPVVPPRSASLDSRAAGAASAPSRTEARATPPARGSRLVLDPQDAMPSPAAMAANASTASELAKALQDLARERARLKSLEETLEHIRGENQATQKALAAMQARLQQTPAIEGGTKGRGSMFYTLIALIAVLGLAVVLLVWQLLRAQRRRAWADDAAEEAALLADMRPDPVPEPAPAPNSVTAVLSPRPPEETRPAAILVDAPPPVFSTTMPAAIPTFRYPEPSGLDPSGPARELSVEELLDLEQQADFFIVLGQDEAAIDLLMGMVRSSGGSTPLPFLKLLEIYRRNGDQASYARIRERFNQRFNAVAPPWEIDPAQGRDLADYTDVLKRLELVWNAPAHALAVLERLLYQRGPEATAFDLSAYADLLFLHRIARDLADVQQAEHGVDLLLPLDVAPDAQPATMPTPISFDLEPFDASSVVDLDVSRAAGGKH